MLMSRCLPRASTFDRTNKNNRGRQRTGIIERPQQHQSRIMAVERPHSRVSLRARQAAARLVLALENTQGNRARSHLWLLLHHLHSQAERILAGYEVPKGPKLAQARNCTRRRGCCYEGSSHRLTPCLQRGHRGPAVGAQIAMLFIKQKKEKKGEISQR
jgi:hypothetical protein